jgi:hypothetical protein
MQVEDESEKPEQRNGTQKREKGEEKRAEEMRTPRKQQDKPNRCASAFLCVRLRMPLDVSEIETKLNSFCCINFIDVEVEDSASFCFMLLLDICL